MIRGLAPFASFQHRYAQTSTEPRDEDCPICWGPLDPTDTTLIMEGDQSAAARAIIKPNVCTHHFHVACLKTHCGRDTRCPCCRREMLPPPSDLVMYGVVLNYLNGTYDQATNLTKASILINSEAMEKLILYAAFACFIKSTHNAATTEEGRFMVAGLTQAAHKLDQRRRTIEYICTFLSDETEYEVSRKMLVTADMMQFVKAVTKLAVHCYAAQTG